MAKKSNAYRLRDTLPYNFNGDDGFGDYMSELAETMSSCKDKFTSLAVSVPNDICPKGVTDPVTYVSDMADTYIRNFENSVDLYSQCIIISESPERSYYRNDSMEFVLSSEIETYPQAEKRLNDLMMREADVLGKMRALFYATPNTIVNGNINPFDYVTGKTAEYFDELLDIHEQSVIVSLLIDNLVLNDK